MPLSASRYTYADETPRYEYRSVLQLIAVDADTGFPLQGMIDHAPFYNDGSGEHYWCNQDIQRAVFMGDFLYAVSDRAVTAHALDTLERSAAVRLPGTDCGGVLYRE